MTLHIEKEEILGDKPLYHLFNGTRHLAIFDSHKAAVAARNARNAKQGVTVQCPRKACSHTWRYTGQSWRACCPHCGTSATVEKNRIATKKAKA